jgi:hypothetical protein
MIIIKDKVMEEEEVVVEFNFIINTLVVNRI